MKNKKGFTLVELLAVIVILALIMSIAVVSISGVLQDTREKTYRETALSIINGVRQRLVLANEQKDGIYYFDDSILESGGKQSSFGGTIQIGNATGTDAGTAVSGTTGIYYKSTTSAPSCSATSKSYVYVSTASGTNRQVYKICLTAGANEKYVAGTEDEVMVGKDASNNSVIKG